MGLLDIPAPLFARIDTALAVALPPTARLVVWAALGGTVAMLLYRALSPQQRIAEAKSAARHSRAALNAYDGDFAGAGPLIRRQLADAMRQLRLVLPASLLAILPLLSLLAWADTRFGHAFPPAGETPAVHADPAALDGRWLAPRDGDAPRIRVLGAGGEQLIEQPLAAPVTVLHQKQWWNWLMANPAGYLPANGPVRQVVIDLPAPEFLPVGPGWMRSWLCVFIPVLFAVSLAIHRLAGIQ